VYCARPDNASAAYSIAEANVPGARAGRTRHWLSSSFITQQAITENRSQ